MEVVLVVMLAVKRNCVSGSGFGGDVSGEKELC